MAVVTAMTIYAAVMMSKLSTKNSNRNVTGINAALTKFGAVVVTVALRLVPNCSDATVTNVAQYPTEKPMRNESRQTFRGLCPCCPDIGIPLPMKVCEIPAWKSAVTLLPGQ